MEEKRKRVLEAAREVFFKYGYVKTTMHDIAVASGISRPALYLIFPGKEEIFNEVMLLLADELSDKVRNETAGINNALDKLRKVFEIWSIRMYELLNMSTEARELYQCTFPFAKESMRKSMEIYENDIAGILSLFPAGQLAGRVTPKEMAHVMAAAVSAFKQNSESSEELKSKIELLIRIAIVKN